MPHILKRVQTNRTSTFIPFSLQSSVFCKVQQGASGDSETASTVFIIMLKTKQSKRKHHAVATQHPGLRQFSRTSNSRNCQGARVQLK